MQSLAGLAGFALFGPLKARSTQISSNSDTTSVEQHCVLPMWRDICPSLADFGPKSSNINPMLIDAGQCSPNSIDTGQQLHK